MVVFHADLLECQAAALSALADADFTWFVDFSNVSGDHEERLIEAEKKEQKDH